MDRMSFEEACRKYMHRFTMEHVPDWATRPAPNGKYYAPQYRSDREWYENSAFPPDPSCHGSDCYSWEPTWPLGKWLDAPYKVDDSPSRRIIRAAIIKSLTAAADAHGFFNAPEPDKSEAMYDGYFNIDQLSAAIEQALGDSGLPNLVVLHESESCIVLGTDKEITTEDES